MQDYLIYVLGDLPAYVSTFDNPSDPNQLIAELSTLQLGIQVDETVTDELKPSLLGGNQEDFYWTFAWNDFIADPENETFRSIVNSRLQGLFQAMFQLSEFQLF